MAEGGVPAFGSVPARVEEAVQRLVAEEPRDHEPLGFDRSLPQRRGFRLGWLLRKHRLAIVIGFLLIVVETVALQAGPLLTQRAIDHGIVNRDVPALVWAAVLFLAAVAVNEAAMRARLAWTGRLGQRLMKQLRVEVFAHIQRLSQSFFSEERIGRVMTRMTSDIDALTQLLQDGIVNLLVQGLTLIIVVTVLFAMHAQLAFVVVFAVLPVMTFLTLWFRTSSDRAYGEVRHHLAEVLSDLQENLAGIRVVAAFNRRHRNAVLHRSVLRRYRTANVKVARVSGIYGPAVDAVGALGEAVIIVVGGRMVLAGELSVGELTAFVLYLTAFFAPIQQLVNLYNTYQSGRAAVVKLDELLSTDPSVHERPDAHPLPRVTGEIRFEAVSFHYKPDAPVLSGIDLVIAAGETLAVVGPTGAGKSTIAKLITRTYDPSDGRVTIDGHDMRDVTLTSLRRQVSVVPQEPFLFSGTVRENLLIGRPDASDAEILEACRLIGLEELLARLPRGLDTSVSERGVALSSGERQLLALARALLPKPRVLVLDEATSNLDLRSEVAVEQALGVLLEGRTAVVIAHRLSTAMRADRILVVDEGRIAELGSHAQLVASKGRYAGMYDTWMSHLEPAG